ncbi:hypothetical protein JMM81_19380 [Bacillus sp. V3B]|uniref:hypothetical protein n=1 Tax=Bacillus sp. V3B TaxID=2804915 RepID=UPI0021096271|nr:hypothetical protein [Bacillus sp. V3B]MCQ6277042.1 hypothetical protein [Bacillus sp. V3B]
MRTWRVGTFSMGASLLFLGLFLLFSQLFGLEMTNVLLVWWPVILVVLGVEILAFLFLSRQDKPFLTYDFLSIFFVGVIGTVGIGFSLFSSTGILEKVDDWLNREEQTIDLPVFEHQVKGEVKRLVVNTGSNPLTIEGITEKEVTMFGTYRALTGKNEKLISDAGDYVSVQQKGETMYLNIKDLPNKTAGPFDSFVTLSATILVPNDIEIEIVGNDNSVNLKPRILLSNWTVNHVAHLSVQMENKSDVKVTAKDVQDFQEDRGKWTIEEENNEEAREDTTIKQATFQTGNGSHHLQIMNSYQVEVNTVD